MATHVIEARGLRKDFGAKTAVEDLSLDVPRGEVFGFLGPNGAGKTTSIKMLLGLVAPTSGSATVLGAPLGDRATRARLGFLPEHFRFQDWLTGRELLRFHARLLGRSVREASARIEALLARVDLLDAANRPIRTYSKGMMQRVGLAQALLGEPDLVFLDEPTSGLDPIGRLLVRDVIREARDRGTTVFLNSHLLGEVEATCDRVVFVKEGRTIHEMAMGERDGAIEAEIRAGALSADDRAVIARLGEILDEEALVPALPDGSDESATAAPSAAATRLRLSVADESRLPEIARALVERGVPLYELRVARKSLEAWFLDVMGEEQRPG
ncbi:MAG TPA: ABC transporter ATP-binding protein [Candidatus Eisenbacteria bacterium]|nr:ABC transporter ATP-binding protein [Candidatus Eisenbacteria bacterium]